MTAANDTALILSRIDALEKAHADNIGELRVDVQGLTQQVKIQNGRVGTLEKWQAYMHGADDTLKTVRDGTAWHLPALAAAVGSIVSAVVGALVYIVFSQ